MTTSRYTLNTVIPQINASKEGQTTIYYRGHYLKDIGKPQRDDWSDSEELRQLFKQVWDMAMEGRLLLTQKRLGEDSYLYQAVKASPSYRLSSGFIAWRAYWEDLNKNPYTHPKGAKK